MSQQFDEDQQTPTRPYQHPKRGIPTAAWASAAIVGALFLGLGLGSSATASADASKPVPTVTKTDIQTKTVTVEKTPPACVVALGLADQLLADAGNGLSIISDSMRLIASGDFSGSAAKSGELSPITADVNSKRPLYQSASSDCRSN